jgi:hypothetical protein
MIDINQLRSVTTRPRVAQPNRYVRSSKVRKHPCRIWFIVSVLPPERNDRRFDETRLNIFPLPIRCHGGQLGPERRFEFVNRRREGCHGA